MYNEGNNDDDDEKDMDLLPEVLEEEGPFLSPEDMADLEEDIEVDDGENEADIVVDCLVAYGMEMSKAIQAIRRMTTKQKKTKRCQCMSSTAAGT